MNTLQKYDYLELAWEPSIAQVTHSYSHRLPDLVDFTGKINCCHLSRSNQLKLSKPNLQHSSGCPKFPQLKFQAIRSRVGIVSYVRA